MTRKAAVACGLGAVVLSLVIGTATPPARGLAPFKRDSITCRRPRRW